MWGRIRRELLIEYYWWKRHTVKKKKMDSPLSAVGILLITLGIFLVIIIGQGFAALFRNMIPLVSGTQVAGTYWSSILFALKMSVVSIIFIGIIVIYFFIKIIKRNK